VLGDYHVWSLDPAGWCTNARVFQILRFWQACETRVRTRHFFGNKENKKIRNYNVGYSLLPRKTMRLPKHLAALIDLAFAFAFGRTTRILRSHG